MNILGLAPVMQRIPAFVVAEPGGHTVGRTAMFSFDPANPWWVRVVVPGTEPQELIVSRFGLHQGLTGDHLEPCGWISICPRTSHSVDWVHIEIDHPGLPAAVVGVRAQLLAGFVSETLALVPSGYEDDFQDMCDDAAFDAWLHNPVRAA